MSPSPIGPEDRVGKACSATSASECPTSLGMSDLYAAQPNRLPRAEGVNVEAGAHPRDWRSRQQAFGHGEILRIG